MYYLKLLIHVVRQFYYGFKTIYCYSYFYQKKPSLFTLQLNMNLALTLSLFSELLKRVGNSNVDLGKIISPVGQYIRSNPGKEFCKTFCFAYTWDLWPRFCKCKKCCQRQTYSMQPYSHTGLNNNKKNQQNKIKIK